MGSAQCEMMASQARRSSWSVDCRQERQVNGLVKEYGFEITLHVVLPLCFLQSVASPTMQRAHLEKGTSSDSTWWRGYLCG